MSHTVLGAERTTKKSDLLTSKSLLSYRKSNNPEYVTYCHIGSQTVLINKSLLLTNRIMSLHCKIQIGTECLESA